MQTVLTVGYGDINCISWNERLFAIFWMLLSVYLYSFAISSITSLLERLDVHNQSYLNKINILKNIAKDYSNVTKPVMTKIQKYMKYGDIKVYSY